MVVALVVVVAMAAVVVTGLQLSRAASALFTNASVVFDGFG